MTVCDSGEQNSPVDNQYHLETCNLGNASSLAPPQKLRSGPTICLSKPPGDPDELTGFGQL